MLVKNAKTAIVSNTLSLGSTIFDFSVGDQVVSGLDAVLGNNANEGVYTIPGYWIDVPMEPMPCPAPTITPKPTPAPIPDPTPNPNLY